MAVVNVYWVKLASWHIVDTLDHGDLTKTLCGRYTLNVQQEDRPTNERSCESCYRRYVARQEAQKADDGSPN